MNFFSVNFLRFPSWVIFFILVFPLLMMHITPLSSVIAAFFLAAWLLSCYFYLRKKMPKAIATNARWFLSRLIYAIIYMATLEFFFHGKITTLLTPFHIVAVISIFSCLFSVSKVLVICEEKRKQRFDKYIGTFLLFWFYPIGVWFIHPRLIRLENETRS